MDKKLRLILDFVAKGNAVGFLKGVKGESERTSRALGAARQRVTDLQRATKDVSAFRAMETRLAGTGAALEAQRAEVRRLAAAHEAAVQPTRALTRAFDLEKTKLEELKTKEVAQIHALAQLEDKLRAAGISTNALGAHERGLARDLDRANTELTEQARRMDQVTDRQRRMNAARGQYDRTQAMAGTMQGAGASSLAAGAAAGAPIVYASQQAMSFEDGMADVRKVVDFETPEQFRQMSNDILDLSTRIPVATEGLTQIVAAAGQARIARGELLGFAEDAGKMGVAFDITADQAGSMMAGWRTAFTMTQPEVRALADQINYLGNTGPANAASISNVVTRIGPLGEIAGLAAGQIAALGSTVVGMGVQEELAATGIKNMMLALTSGEAATKAQSGAFKALGLDATVMARRMQTDAGGAITDVMQRISNLSPDRQASVLKQLFGSESIAAIAPLLTNLDLLKENLTKVGDATRYAGSMQTEFENRASATSNALLLAKQSGKALGVEIGTNFLPEIQKGSEFLNRMATNIRNFSAEHPGATRAVSGLVAIVATGLIVFGGLALVAAAILGPFALLQFAWVGALPILTALGGGVAAAAAAMWTFTAALLANPITWIVVAVLALATAAFLIYRNWGPISSWFGGIWEQVKSATGSALSFLGNLLMNFSPIGMLVGAFTRAWPALQALGSRFLELGGQLLSGLVNGVVGGVPRLVAAIASAAGSAITAFKERLGIRSPSRVFMALGGHTMAGLGVGLSAGQSDVVNRVRGVASAVAAAGAISLSAGAMALSAGTASAEVPTFSRPSVEFETGSRLVGGPAPARSGGGGSARPTSVTINVYQLPGENQEGLANRIGDEFRDLGLGRFGDDDFGEAP